MRHSPLIIAFAGALIVTAAAAWIVKAIVAIGKATRLGKAQP